MGWMMRRGILGRYGLRRFRNAFSIGNSSPGNPPAQFQANRHDGESLESTMAASNRKELAQCHQSGQIKISELLQDGLRDEEEFKRIEALFSDKVQLKHWFSAEQLYLDTILSPDFDLDEFLSGIKMALGKTMEASANRYHCPTAKSVLKAATSDSVRKVLKKGLLDKFTVDHDSLKEAKILFRSYNVDPSGRKKSDVPQSLMQLFRGLTKSYQENFDPLQDKTREFSVCVVTRVGLCHFGERGPIWKTKQLQAFDLTFASSEAPTLDSNDLHWKLVDICVLPKFQL